VAKPWELQRAELIDGLCQRYGCRPSQLLAEPVDLLLPLLALLAEAAPEDSR
jgi:hypothetical protein